MLEQIAQIQLTTNHWYDTIELPGELPILSLNLSLCDDNFNLRRHSSNDREELVPICDYGIIVSDFDLKANQLFDIGLLK